MIDTAGAPSRNQGGGQVTDGDDTQNQDTFLTLTPPPSTSTQVNCWPVVIAVATALPFPEGAEPRSIAVRLSPIVRGSSPRSTKSPWPSCPQLLRPKTTTTRSRW